MTICKQKNLLKKGNMKFRINIRIRRIRMVRQEKSQQYNLNKKKWDSTKKSQQKISTKKVVLGFRV